VQTASGKMVVLALLSLGILLLAGCPRRENIALINHEPGRFGGREVTIAGKVVNSFAVMGEGAFEVDDGTGRMWVFSDKFGVPGRDAGLAVTGRVQQTFSMGGRHFPIILHETRPPRY
jgi:hypothetical protein